MDVSTELRAELVSRAKEADGWLGFRKSMIALAAEVYGEVLKSQAEAVQEAPVPPKLVVDLDNGTLPNEYPNVKLVNVKEETSEQPVPPASS